MEGKNMERETGSPSFFSILLGLLVTNSCVPAKSNLLLSENKPDKLKYKPDLDWSRRAVQAEEVCLDLWHSRGTTEVHGIYVEELGFLLENVTHIVGFFLL